jgi:hypothetical protein
MHRFLIPLFLFIALAANAADTGRIVKVLPFLLDSEGRIAKSPSLFERDAYQAYLRQHTNEISGLRYDVQCRAGQNLKLRLELRGVGEKNLPKFKTIETDIVSGSFGNWTQVKLVGDDYKNLGAVTAWHATLWKDGTQLSEQKSFLW